MSVAAWALRGVAALSLRGGIWAPFLLVAGVQLVLLGVLISFHVPLLLPLAYPLLKLLGGEEATHYPNLYYALPSAFYRANLVISAVISSVAGGAATLMFAKGFGLEPAIAPWRRALRRAPTLIAVTALVMAVLFGTSWLSTSIPSGLTAQNTGLRWGLRFLLLGLFILVQSFMAYTTAWIVLMGHGVWAAFRDSVRVTGRTFLPTMIVVGVPALLVFPFSYMSSRADYVASRLRPEMVAGFIGLEVVCQTLMTFLLVGAVTRLFLWRVEAAR